MASTSLDYLRNLRIDEIMADTQDARTLPGNLKFLARLKRNPAANSELIAKNQGRVQIAPMIATNAKAPVFKADRYTVESATLGKIKYGTHWSEDEMEEWLDLLKSPIKDPDGILSGNMVRNAVVRQLEGIEQQLEWLSVAMALNGKLGTSAYNRFGYFLENITWGRYTDLYAPFPIDLQANAGTCTPIDYILSMKQRLMEKYGKEVNRITLGTSTLRCIYNTTEYQNKSRQFLAPNVSYVNLPLTNNPLNRQILSQVLEGMEVVTYDTRYWTENDAGTWASARFLPNQPVAPIILDDSATDGMESVQDMGIGIPMESQISGMGVGLGDSQIIGGPSGGVNRAVSYGTVEPRLDPPGLTIYSVMKAFPRLFDRASNAVLTVGPITELIGVSDDLDPV